MTDEQIVTELCTMAVIDRSVWDAAPDNLKADLQRARRQWYESGRRLIYRVKMEEVGLQMRHVEGHARQP